MSSDVSLLLCAIQRGDSRAEEELIPLVYHELREMARAKLAQESPGQTLQATALVHEVYLRLFEAPESQPWHGRRYFFAAAAEAMRRILIENARRKEALKRGGDWERIDVSMNDLPEAAADFSVLEIDEALTRLAVQDAQAAELVKLRYFTGLSLEEVAAMLEISERSAYRLWAYARSFLWGELAVER